ncbi:MAG: cytochrome c oxidase subunit 3 [Phycisphaerae bacterium]|nr:cytochrome c oxidase subunit 3 [Phycisphaerae bacterium]
MADAAHPHAGGLTHGSHDAHAAPGGGGHAHSSVVAHHFDDAEQQFDSAKLGMWLFLATEVLLFGGLFCAYFVWRSNQPEIFLHGHAHLNKTLGAVNTVILLLSSFTMAWAVSCSQKGNKNGLILGLALTLLGGFGFLGIKFVEYKEKIEHGYLWGNRYAPTVHHDDAHGAEAGHASEASHGAAEASHAASAPASNESHAAESHAPAEAAHAATPAAATPAAAAPVTPYTPLGATAAKLESLKYEPTKALVAASGVNGLKPPPKEHKDPAHHGPDLGPEPKATRTYFSIYFCMTGLHGIHVVIGMIVIAWLLYRAMKGEFGPEYFTPVDLGGLYWHLVDLIWIYLFPLLYLIE